MNLSSLRFKLCVGACLAVMVLGRCFWLWQPERQVRLHQEHLLEAASKRNWGKLNSLIDDGFKAGPLDKRTSLGAAAAVLQPFLSVEITGSETALVREGNVIRVSEVIRIDGTGSPFGDSIKGAVNQSTEPFEFTWVRKSWEPWDWRLTEVKHSLMERAGDFQ